MKIPLSYSFRSLWTRKLTTFMTVTGIALVVFVFAAVLMLAAGLRETLIGTGSDDNAIVIRKSADSETISSVGFDQAEIISTLPEVATGSDGKPLITKEVATMINLQKHGGLPTDLSNIVVRGVSSTGVAMRPQIKMISGRMLTFGTSEIIIGNQVADRFDGTGLGQKIKFGGRLWTVVGHFDAGKSGFASNIWGDKDQILQAFSRQAYSSIMVKLKNKSDFKSFASKIESDPRTNDLESKVESVFYSEQSEALSKFITAIGLVVTILFSFGAMIGAMITMYAAVANRTVEIGTLRALGFQRTSVLAAFLFESLFIALIGGLLGLAIASCMSLITVSTTNFATFSEVAFGFSLTSGIVISTLIFAAVMGIVGGFLPSFRASRLDIINALRAS